MRLAIATAAALRLVECLEASDDLLAGPEISRPRQTRRAFEATVAAPAFWTGAIGAHRQLCRIEEADGQPTARLADLHAIEKHAHARGDLRWLPAYRRWAVRGLALTALMLTLNACGGAMALSAAGGAITLAKDVVGLDVSIHQLEDAERCK
jgi:hypothetical protein